MISINVTDGFGDAKETANDGDGDEGEGGGWDIGDDELELPADMVC